MGSHRPRVLGISLLGIVGGVAILLSFAGGRGNEYTRSGSDLKDLITQFQSASSLSFSASVAQVFSSSNAPPCEAEPSPPPEPVEGQLDYLASGDNYRINSYLEPDKAPGMQTQVAWDGQKFQLLLSNGTLSCSSRNSASLLPILPNPLLELLQFRYPLTDENYRFDISLKDVRDDRIPDEFFNVVWTRVEEGDRILERAVFPGGTYEDQTYVHQVYTLPGHRNMPVRIDRVTKSGRITSAEFSDYVRLESSQGPTFWPRNVVLLAFDLDGIEAGRISYAIGNLAVNTEHPKAAFVLDPAAATRIWDDDRGTFVTTTKE
jgi:hypothetical protein